MSLTMGSSIAFGGTPASPVTMDNDCLSGGIFWEYTNDHPGPVTIVKQRIILPKELGYHINTTLNSWGRTLQPGQSMSHGITGIIYVEEGKPVSKGTITPMPDGKYVNNIWLTDGATDWFVKQVSRRNCGVAAHSDAGTLVLDS